MPWARAIEATRAGEYTGIIGAYKDEVPEFVFTAEALLRTYGN